MIFGDKPEPSKVWGFIESNKDINELDFSDFLKHYGRGHLDGGHSGRYRWGSGDEPYQHSGDFLSRVETLRSKNITFKDPQTGKTYSGDTAVARTMGMSTTAFRAQVALAKQEEKQNNMARVTSLKEKGLSNTEIGRRMGLNESSVRSLLNQASDPKPFAAQKTAEFLKSQVDKKGMIDVGAGVELSDKLNISKQRMDQALEILKAEGYHVYAGGVPQVTNPGKQTNLKVLATPDKEHKDIYDFKTGKLNIQSIDDYISKDGGETYEKTFVYPKSMDSSRIYIRYAEQGGVNYDGTVEIRRGVPDLSLGNSHYAQVRVLVDGTHYVKGMAIYSDNVPAGYDMVFNTNKHEGTAKLDVLKKIKDNPENPFGALIKDGVNDANADKSQRGGQSYYIDSKGNKQLSLINKTREEGDWMEWSKKLPSQMLSKQPIETIKKQLKLTIAEATSEYDTIKSLTNPTLQKHLLDKFASECDSAAVHLKAAALPRQSYKVILPIASLKDNEVYAPGFSDGEKLALIRYPHASITEIPILTVNNKQKEAKSVLGNALDAIGINANVASRLSGADFDGDTVTVIPTHNGKVKIQSAPQYDALKGFDTKSYQFDHSEEVVNKKTGETETKYYRNGCEFKIMGNTQNEMGQISNLISDMTLKNASSDEMVRAMKHSMVVIDAEKHKLDYKQSYKDNQIAELKAKYQGHIDSTTGRYSEGASTLISLAKSQESVVRRKGSAHTDPETGELVWKNDPNATYVNKDGKIITRKQKSTKMAETKDAYTLSSGTPQEDAYASYANTMKAMANKARLDALNISIPKRDPVAAKEYKNEVESLNSKLLIAKKNAPYERRAQLLTNVKIEAMKQADPSLKDNKKEVKKIGQQQLTKYRAMVGAKRNPIEIDDKEWKAIQSNAISSSKLKEILDNTNIDALKQRAMPRQTTSLSDAKVNKIDAMRASGYTLEQIAKAIGYSTSTVSRYIKGGK